MGREEISNDLTISEIEEEVSKQRKIWEQIKKVYFFILFKYL